MKLEWDILCCLLDNKYKFKVLSKISEKHFSGELTKSIFTYCKQQIYDDKPYNIESILLAFKSNAALIKKSLLIIDTSIYESYINALINEYIERKKIDLSIQLRSSSCTKEQILYNINNFIRDIYASENSDVLQTPDIPDEVANFLITNTGQFEGIKTYIKSLDDKINGVKNSDYVIIAGRPSMGKTALACHIACKNAMNGIPVLFFSLEMNKKQIWTRLYAAETNIELYKLKRGLLSDIDREIIKEVQHTFRSMPLIIRDNGNIDIFDIMSVAQRAKIKYPNLGLIIVDYMQFMTGEGKGNRNEILGDISRGFKTIAKEYKVPVIAISQLSRLCEMRPDKRPQLSDLRESGAIEQDADIVMFVYRDHYYNYNPLHESICEINISKFRDGEVGKVVVEYSLKKQTWKDISHTSKLWEIAKKFMYQES